MNFFKTIYSELRESHSTIVFAALEVLISTLLLHSEVWALVEVIDLIIDDSPKKLVAIAAKLSPWNLHKNRQLRLRNTFAMLTTLICCRLQIACFMDIFDPHQPIHKTHHGYQL